MNMKTQGISTEQFNAQYPELGIALHEVAKRYQNDATNLAEEYTMRQAQLSQDYEETINQLILSWYQALTPPPQPHFWLVPKDEEN